MSNERGFKLIKKLYKFITEIVRNISSDEITVYSAQASYYIAISSFPFIMLLISLAGFFLPQYRETIFSSIQNIIPHAIQPAITAVASELFEKSIPIVSISAATSLWSASRGIAAVERGICRVYKTPGRKNFIISSFFSIIYTVVFIAILLSTLLLQVFGDIILEMLNKYITLYSSEIILLKSFLFFIVMCAIFALMYYFFSKRTITFINHLPGAMFSSAGWMIFSYVYSIYIENFANYSYIYGSLTAVVLMLLWLYCCVIILLAGAELNKYILEIVRKKV